ncbi:SMP-30/gluconolactonase/LRE family protein [Chitinophaga japonensis]|uniref:Gluconolactonase n=1 Tax=Chitinophaga japonensis TaxID=104662 RepID=A0A562T6X8_CHIJA|nr:SMP-30/gluconolactonase/LRE family protein [Chitinophaga japonensis]TWI89004.1 gluconolactonase [Chitinophaga japonensis]
MNKYRYAGLLLITFLTISMHAFSQEHNTTELSAIAAVAPGATLHEVSRRFAFTEGPAADKAGNIYFTDQPNNRIWKFDTQGQLSLYMEPSGRSNGMYFDPEGNLVSCADEKDELWSISPDKKVTVLLRDFQGRRLNGPNDLWIDAKGGIYFTDPYYQRDYWDRTEPEIKEQRVYYLPKGAKEAIIVEDQLEKPNGIVGTPDGRYLYVADIQGDKTYKYRIQADGRLGERQLFVSQGSDGMTLDNEGNLYLTGRGVTIYDPAGNKLGNIPVSPDWTANVCFGGKDGHTLFITASKAVYTLQMKVKRAE